MEYFEHPELGSISKLSLGSWNTFSRCSTDELVGLLGRALDNGINSFDVGYYWDKPDTEAAVASALRRLGFARDSFVIASKLWLWNYPKQDFRSQLTESLSRLDLDHTDLVMVSRPTAEVDLSDMLEEVVALVKEGLARGYGITNFTAEQMAVTVQLCDENGWPYPVWQQMQYNAMRRAIVESDEYSKLFETSGIKLCAANIFEGGILAGHLERDRVDPKSFEQGVRPHGRNIARDSGGIRPVIRERQPALQSLARRIGASAPQLALATVLKHPNLATALIGVTSEEQLIENLGAFEIVSRLAEVETELAALSVDEVGHPNLFTPHEPTG